MNSIKNISDKRLEKGVEKVKELFSEVADYNHEYEEAAKESRDFFYKLANKVYDMKNDQIIEWEIEENNEIFTMGSTKKWVMDCDLIITCLYGGGQESVLYVNDYTTGEDIYNYLKNRYKDIKIASTDIRVRNKGEEDF